MNNPSSSPINPVFSLITIIMLLGTMPAHAREGVLEEIIVTAQFREQNLQDTPLAIPTLVHRFYGQKGNKLIYFCQHN